MSSELTCATVPMCLGCGSPLDAEKKVSEGSPWICDHCGEKSHYCDWGLYIPDVARAAAEIRKWVEGSIGYTVPAECRVKGVTCSTVVLPKAVYSYGECPGKWCGGESCRGYLKLLDLADELEGK